MSGGVAPCGVRVSNGGLGRCVSAYGIEMGSSRTAGGAFGQGRENGEG
jgi:hypothetical protein